MEVKLLALGSPLNSTTGGVRWMINFANLINIKCFFFLENLIKIRLFIHLQKNVHFINSFTKKVSKRTFRNKIIKNVYNWLCNHGCIDTFYETSLIKCIRRLTELIHFELFFIILSYMFSHQFIRRCVLINLL